MVRLPKNRWGEALLEQARSARKGATVIVWTKSQVDLAKDILRRINREDLVVRVERGSAVPA